MDKRTIIAVVLSVVVISVSMIIQGVIWPRDDTAVAQTVDQSQEAQVMEGQESAQPAPQPTALAQYSTPSTIRPAETEEEPREDVIRITSDLYTVTLSNRGGVVTSMVLHQHVNRDGTPVEMIMSGTTGEFPFTVHFGGFQTVPANDLFEVNRSLTNPYEISFSREYLSETGVPFTLTKTYFFSPLEYMFELRIGIRNSVNDFPALDFDGISYTLGFGPQIGPEYKKLDQRNEFRQYIYREAGKKKTLRMPREGVKTLVERVSWVSITGKYFTAVAVPDATQYLITYDARKTEGIQDRSSMYLSRPIIKSARSEDVFRFYIGPKERDILRAYDDPEKNGFGVGDLHLTDTVSTRALIGWLSSALMFMLDLIYRVVPNYGVAIILLTILIKIVLFPLSRKSFASTARMQEINPKLEALRAKYKDKPEIMNREIAALYKKEGVSPMGGCLPLLLQMPIFFAFYDLLSTHFGLRGAPFISPWIADLSGPEVVASFGFTIPLLNWTDLRILPFVMLVTTFLQTKVSQTPSAGSQKNMKMMTYAMPIFFFFILYNMPSGLVLYWTMQNIISVLQQLGINYLKKRKAAGGGGSSTAGPPRRKQP